MAKRLRMAAALNTTGRLLYFYGLGIALSSNNNNHDEYKFEAYLADDAEKFIGCRSYAARVGVKRSVRVCMSQCRVESSECDRGG